MLEPISDLLFQILIHGSTACCLLSMILIFTFFYTAITINSNDIADNLKRNGGFVPGVKPGKQTAEFIDTVLSRITLPGALFLAGYCSASSICSEGGSWSELRSVLRWYVSFDFCWCCARHTPANRKLLADEAL